MRRLPFASLAALFFVACSSDPASSVEDPEAGPAVIEEAGPLDSAAPFDDATPLDSAASEVEADAMESPDSPSPTSDSLVPDSMPVDSMPVDSMSGDSLPLADSTTTAVDSMVAIDSSAPATDSGAVTPPLCGKPPAEPPSPPVTPKSDPYPKIAHWEKPVVGNVVALTFDDGPNPLTTNKVLDVLKKHGIRATFFLNSRSRGDIFADPAAATTVARELAEGHVIGNHTSHHYDLALDSSNVEAELSLLEADIRAFVPCAPPLTLVRAPFGSPYLSGTTEQQAKVFPIVAKHGVHIGWAIDPTDYGATSSTAWVARVLERIDADRRGPILMHDTEQTTADGLESLILALESRGIGFVTAEKLVRDKYGKTSAELVVK